MSDTPAPPYPGAPADPPPGQTGWEPVPASAPTNDGWGAPGQPGGPGPMPPPAGYQPAAYGTQSPDYGTPSPGYSMPSPGSGPAAPAPGYGPPPGPVAPSYTPAPPAPPGPMPAAPPPGGWAPGYPQPGYGQPAYGQPGYGQPGYGQGAVPLNQLANVVAKPSRKGRVAAAGIGALALVSGGLFAVTQLGGGQSGAATPEAAVQQLINSFNNEDLLGVMNSLPKSERETFLPLAEQTLAELKRLGVLSERAQLEGVSGFDVEYTDYRMVVDSVADTVANVEVSGGRIRGGYDLAQLPLGQLIIDNAFDGEAPDDARSASEEMEEEFTLTTIKDGDGWHVSVWYSVAEAARDEAGAPVPAFGRGVAAAGAASPEAAVEEMFAAMSELDVRRMIELTPPDQAAALHDYAPLFLPDVEREVEDLKDETGLEMEIFPTGLSASGKGNTRTVSFDGFTARGSADGSDFEMTYADGCYSWELDGESDELCDSRVFGESELPDSYRQMYENIGSQPRGIQVVERDGAWYVSPVGTVGEGMLSVLRALDQQLLQDLIDDADELTYGLFEGVGLFNEAFDLGAVDLNNGDVFDDYEADEDFNNNDWEVGSAYDEYYTECGELQYDVYGATTSAEFQAAILAAHGCALPFLQSGALDEFDVGSEIARPECYPTWPWDPNLTVGQQQEIYQKIDDCLAKPANF